MIYIFKNRIKINPTSNYIILIISTLISLSMSTVAPNSIDQNSSIWDVFLFYMFKQSIIKDLKLAYVIFVIWFILAFLHGLYSPTLDSQDNEIERLNKELTETKKDLKSEAGLLLTRYSDLTKFKIKDVLQENLRKFIESKYSIESAQLYKYTYIPEKNNIIIKVEYSGGHVKENVNINSIMQSYYSVPNYILEKINIIVNLYKKLEDDELDGYEIVEEFAYSIFDTIDNYSQEIINDVKERLIENYLDEFEDKDADLYAILRTVISMLYEDENDTESNTDDSKNFKIITELSQEIAGQKIEIDLEKELKLRKRTGILESILRQGYAIFQHEGLSEKNGRAYISKCISLNGEKYVLLMTSNPTISKDFNWEQKLLNLCCELEENLKNNL